MKVKKDLARIKLFAVYNFMRLFFEKPFMFSGNEFLRIASRVFYFFIYVFGINFVKTTIDNNKSHTIFDERDRQRQTLVRIQNFLDIRYSTFYHKKKKKRINLFY